MGVNVEPELLLTFSDIEKAFMAAHIDAVREENKERRHMTSRFLLGLAEIDKDPLVKSAFEEDAQAYLALRKDANWDVSPTKEWARTMETVNSIRREACSGRFEEIVNALAMRIPAGIIVGIDDAEREFLRTTLESALAIVQKRLTA